MEAASVADGYAALNRCFLIRLAETAKAVVADDGSAARDGDGVAALVLGVRRRRKRRGGEKHAEARARKSLHDGQILAGCGSSLPAALRAGLCRGPVLSDSLSFGETPDRKSVVWGKSGAVR